MDLTVRDAARLLQTSEKTVYRWMRDGSLPCHRVAEKYRLNRVELLEWATRKNLRVLPEIFAGGADAPAAGSLAAALRRGGIHRGIFADDAREAIAAATARLPLPAKVNREELLGVLLAREALGSTAIGGGIAIPHPRSPVILGLDESLVAVAVLDGPVDFGAMDGRKVDLLFTIVATTIRGHLHLLSHLMAALRDVGWVEALRSAAADETVYAGMDRIESALPGTGRS